MPTSTAPKGEAGVVAIFIENLLAGQPSVVNAYPNESRGMDRDYCYVEDVARANILAMASGSAAGDVFNIGTGSATKTADLYDIIYNAYKTATEKHSGNEPDSSLADPPRGAARKGDLTRSCLNVEKAKLMLGWKPDVNLIDGIRKTIARYPANR